MDEEALTRLDRVEGASTILCAPEALQNDMEVWVCVMRREILTAKPRIASGDWRKWKRQKRSQLLAISEIPKD